MKKTEMNTKVLQNLS